MADNKYFTLLTDKGRFKIAAAAANKVSVKITHLAIGDGGGQETNPMPAASALVHEVWRTPVEAVEIDPKNPAAVLVAAIIPYNIGGWWMREFGIFDVDGELLAVVKPVPAYKAIDADGQLEDIYYQFQLVIGEQAEVVVMVDPSILWATREYVNTRRVPMSQLMSVPWLPVKAMDVSTPPANAAIGDIYLVPISAKGDWQGKTGQLAEWTGKDWSFMQPADGHGISLPDSQVFQKAGGQYQPKIAQDVQSGRWSMGAAAGSPDKLTARLTPPLRHYMDGLVVRLRIDAVNAGAVTLDAGAGAKSIRRYNGADLQPGDLAPGGIAEFIFDTVRDCWQLNILPNMIDAVKVYEKAGKYTFVVPAGITKVDVEIWGGGGGSGACGNLLHNCGSTGGGGGYARKTIAGLQAGEKIPLQVGLGGKAGTISPLSQPDKGGTSFFGDFVSATGGGAGQSVSGELPTTAGIGGKGFGGDVTIAGGNGGLYWVGLAGAVTVAASGTAAFNPTGQPGSGNGAGAMGRNSGDAGTGAVTSSKESYNGGAGADGKIIIRW